MISQKLQDALNEQIVAEMWSANLYLSMSFFFDGEGFSGFANWMKKQSQEETEHAYQMADFIIKRGGKAVLGKIEAVPQAWESPLAAFEMEGLIFPLPKQVGQSSSVATSIAGRTR